MDKNSKNKTGWYWDFNWSTQGHKKFINYVKALLKTEKLQYRIRQWRKKYKIPSKGLKPYKQGDVYPPPAIKDFYKLEDEIFKFTEDSKMNSDYAFILTSYILYNKIHPEALIVGCNVCEFRRLNQESPLTKTEIDSFPMAILISPYATQNDITNFATKIWPLIEQTSKTYPHEHKIGKIKTRNETITLRNQLIYDNRYFPNKAVSEKVMKKFDPVDQGNIGKIISIEKKRRKEV